MEPDNIILGDNTGVELPQATPEEDFLIEEKKMAKYSKTAEFKRLKEWCEARIEFYQSYLPDGREINAAVPSAEDWRVANRLIAEFKLLLASYDTAREVVDGLPTSPERMV